GGIGGRWKGAARGMFSGVFGVGSINVGSKATARTALISQARYVAPIAVNKLHPMLIGCNGGPCLGKNYPTTIPVSQAGAPGAFAPVNLLNQTQGTSGASGLASWIEDGSDGLLKIGGHIPEPAVKRNHHPDQ